MSGERVPPEVGSGEHDLEQTPRVARVRIEDGFGARMRGWIAKSGAKFTDVARALGVKREELYEVMDGEKHARAAWLELLPPAVEQLFLAERAAAHGLELTQVRAEGPRAAADVVRELAEAMTASSSTDADQYIDPAEAERELEEWEDVIRMAAARRELLREAIRRRGLSLKTGGA